MTTAAACRTCGTEPLEHARFCHGCGSPVEDAGIRAEYKQVTVLFADVVHSMDLAAAVGAERLREIMADLVDRCAAVVKRYGGTVDKFTGDGVMAVFGAPVALEDHAFRACLAALDIQTEVAIVAAEVKRLNNITLQLRIGLNSGQVIAGEIGSATASYTTIGEQVGMAQRMESAAPPGGVMLSESTARLVENAVVLGECESVHIKNVDAAVHARRLLAVGEHRPGRRAESRLVGRTWELNTVTAILDEAVGGAGCVVNVMGPPGIGKSRLVREATATAATRGVPVYTTYCESHASDIPFHVVARLLRTSLEINDLAGDAARARVRERFTDADPDDLMLLDDLLGIRDGAVALPDIAPDARRRRLTALLNAASLARAQPAVYVIEDVHWIDEVSESMLAAFLAVIPHTPALVLITHRPDYRGALSRVADAQSVALRPLKDAHSSALTAQLLGADPSVAELAAQVCTRAAGNPFFVEEMVRDLAERGVVHGQPGAYLMRGGLTNVDVPPTLQATLGARIDRLGSTAKHTLNAAAVIGARFDPDLLGALVGAADIAPLVEAQLVEQVRFTPHAEYAFRHPLIRTVAYESQLKSDRAQLHRRLSTAIQERGPESLDENAALIAEHLEAAGDLHAAFEWHMRAGAWSTNRDLGAAWVSWERARQIADALSENDPDRTAMQIAARTMLCGIGWRVYSKVSDRFDELRELCSAAGDKASLAIGMTGLGAEHFVNGRVREALQVGSELMTLVESIGDPALMLGLAFTMANTKFVTGEMAEVLRWSQTTIDLAHGDPAKGNLVIGSPLAVALATRGTARYALGDPGWRDDLDRAVAMARGTDPWSRVLTVMFTYGAGIEFGVLLADDAALREIEEALSIAERSGDDLALGSMWLTLGVALMHRESATDRERGLALLEQVRDLCLSGRFHLFELRLIDVYTTQEMAARGDSNGALPLMRVAVKEMFDAGVFVNFDWSTFALVETLLDRGADGDVGEAEAAIDRLAAAPTDEGLVIRDIWLLRLQALLARAHGDDARYREHRDHYRDMAKSLGFEGHIAWAEAMP